MPALILDGARLARRREPMIGARVSAVQERRGTPPGLLLLAFAEPDGRVPHVAGKVRACDAVGIATVPVVMAHDSSTAEAVDALNTKIERQPVDGVFVQFPFPPSIDGDALAAAIPPALDVDVMTNEGAAAFMNDIGPPPVTVSAAIVLLEEYDVRVDGRRGIVVADESPFTMMFREAFARLGAAMDPLVAPDAADLGGILDRAELVVAAAAQPSLIRSQDLAAGAVAIDVGYFNPGGRGDIDVSAGIEHLTAIIPVPGGIGPMTVSALVERVTSFAERV